MFEPDWEELFLQTGLADVLEFQREFFMAIITTTPPEMEATPSSHLGFPTTVLRSPRPKTFVSQPSASKVTNMK